MKIKTMLALVLGALVAGVAMASDLAVSAYWQDHMVLQRGKPITVWGKDVAGRTVTVSFAGQNANATTGSDGFWETTFAQPFALSATPQTLTITDDANESITLSDILVGDVFLASGQSNMDRRLKYGDFDEPQSVKDFCRDDDGIRFIRIAKSYENSPAGEQLFDLPPLKEIDVNVGYRGEGFDWAPATMGGAASNKYHVSSVALNFAHYLRRANAEKGQDIPIGIIHASYGGTYIRHWIRPAAIAAGGFQTVSTDARCWNIMLAPILRAKFCAVLWYQGCSDADTSCVNDYKAMMDILVNDWRARWGENGNLPFYAVQIGAPNYNSASGTIGLDQYPAPTEDNVGHNYAPIREHQRRWNMSDAGKHGLVTIVDCVDCLSNGSLHPTDKNFVGRRLSLLARRDIYGETDLPAEGPTYTRAVRESNGFVRIFFKSGTAKGLTAGRMRLASQTDVSSWVKKSTDPIRGFAVCGSDNVWKDAVATVDGETIVLRADGVAAPTKFHYGYWCVTRETLLEDGQRLNLYNEAGLPMSPVAPQAVEDPATSGQVADPVLAPASCFFSPSTNVTIACATSGATIRYTLNGSEPDETSAVYSAPITISATTTVKARAFAANKDPSDVVFATYTLGEAPAPEPNPLWEPGMYKFAEWTPLANNLLSGLTTSYVVNSLDPWNGSVVCLTDGSVSSNLVDDTVGIGIRDGATLSWSFTTPKTIETIRLTACGYNHMYKYDKILVESVEVLQNGEWNQIGGSVAFNGLDSYGSDQSLYATLADEVTGRLATNATGLRITFGNPKNLGKCRYAEIEASGYDASGEPTPTVATPAFNPASCAFFPSTNVALTCATEGAVIRYTLDGSNPTSSSAEYTAWIALSATTTIKARAFAGGMNASAVASATYTYAEPGNPPDDPPPDEPGLVWTTGDYDPASWTALENNILAGLTAVATDASLISFAASKDLSKLTDGVVDQTADSTNLVGFRVGAEIAWTFAEPMTVRKLRFQSLQEPDKKIYAGIRIADVLVQTSHSSDWVSLGASFSKSGLSTSAGAQYALVENPGLGYLALDVTKLKVVFGTAEAFADYYPEIEAVGERSGATPAASPVLATPKVIPWGASAEFRCSLASIGSGASKCDVTLAYGPDSDHLGTPSVIYSGSLAAFNYELEGLSLNTTYSYRLTALNDAAAPASCTVDGTFTTTSEVRPDWSAYKWAVIGDSLTDPTLAPGIGNYYYNFVARDTGIQLVYTNGVGSTGYKNKYNVDGGKCFYQRLLTNPLPSDVDVVTIFGSVNDWGLARSAADVGTPTDSIDDGKETLAAYMNKAIDVVQAQAPNAKLVLVGSLYYYNVVASAHELANETLRAVAAQRGVAFYDWLTENPDDPLDFHHIADNPTAEGSFAQRYTRDCPATIIPGETSFGHPSAEYHEVWLSPHFRDVLTTALSGVPVPVTVATPTFSPASCNFYPTTNVTITCATSGATIYYTLDGSEPTAESDAYSAPIAVSATTTVKARAFADGMNASAVASATYTYTEPVEPPDPPQPGDKMFYIGETGYDSWSDAYNAAQNGDTITVGQNATMAISGGKTVTIDLAGGALNWEGSGYYTGATITVVDSDGDGRLTLAGYSRNVSGATVDLSALTAEQLALDGAGLFWTSAATVIKFPSGMALADCTPRLGNKAVDQVIVVQGVTYTWDGSNWVSDTPGHAITITAPQNGTLETSVTNNVAVGTVVTVTATPAEGYQLVSVTTNGVALAGNTFTMPSEDVTVAATFEETLIATYDITITAPQNGTLETSVTNNVAAGTTVTVIATPASGYRLASVTTNGVAIVGTTFAMPAGDVTLAATFAENAEPTQMFYIGETGYDSWTDVYAAAKDGDTIIVGANATMANVTEGKTLTIDLAGRSLEWAIGSSGWMYGTRTVVDSVGGGRLNLSSGGRNVSGGTVDLSSLTADQLAGNGTFWTRVDTVVKFPSGMALADCTPRLGNKAVDQVIVVQGVTYTWDGSSWVPEGKSYPEWIDSTSQTLTAKYDTWAAKFNVADPTAAQKDAYLLNCANTAEAVATAKAAFTVVSVSVNADGTVDVGLPTAPDGGFNGTVAILGSETVDGTYHTVTTGTLLEALYRIPAASNDRFFKASMDIQ